jgi:hypothetical protein
MACQRLPVRAHLKTCERLTGHPFPYDWAAVLSPSPPSAAGGEGRGEVALLIGSPSLRLSPRSFLAGREGKSRASTVNKPVPKIEMRPVGAGGFCGAPLKSSVLERSGRAADVSANVRFGEGFNDCEIARGGHEPGRAVLLRRQDGRPVLSICSSATAERDRSARPGSREGRPARSIRLRCRHQTLQCQRCAPQD